MCVCVFTSRNISNEIKQVSLMEKGSSLSNFIIIIIIMCIF